jgi:hypothetical protein
MSRWHRPGPPIRPIEASKAAVCYVRNTIPDVQALATNVQSGSTPAGRRRVGSRSERSEEGVVGVPRQYCRGSIGRRLDPRILLRGSGCRRWSELAICVSKANKARWGRWRRRGKGASKAAAKSSYARVSPTSGDFITRVTAWLPWVGYSRFLRSWPSPLPP